MLDRLWLIPVGFVIGAYGNSVLDGYLVRNLPETDGTSHTFSYSPKVGIGLSLVVGSTFLQPFSTCPNPGSIHYRRSPNNLLNSSDSTRRRRATSRSLSTSSGGSLNAVGSLLKCIRSASSLNASNFTSIT